MKLAGARLRIQDCRRFGEQAWKSAAAQTFILGGAGSVGDQSAAAELRLAASIMEFRDCGAHHICS